MKTEIIHQLLSLGVQLKIVEGNLKVNAPKGVLTKELLEEISAHKAYLINLITANSSIPRAEAKESYAVTPTQYFMWFTHEYLGGSRAYNITATLKLQGKLDKGLLEKAFQYVMARHESLRTFFRKNQNDEVQQYIRTEEEAIFRLQTMDLQHLSKEQLHDQIKQEYQKSFDLGKDLLLSATLLKSKEDEHILVFVLHHIIGDGWSLQLLTREVMLAYNSLASETAIPLAPLALQYKDYSEWLSGKLSQPEYAAKLDYWKQQFATKPVGLELVQGKRPAVKTYTGRIHHHEFPKPFSEALANFAREHQMTLFMLLSGGLSGLFSRYTGQNDITLGTTVAGREHADLEHQIGLYSNALPIRAQFEKEDSFLLLMQKQKQILLKAYENKEYPFTALVNHLSLPKDQSRSALFDIMVLLQNHQGMEINDQKGINGVTASEYTEIERGVSQLDISFVFVEKEEGLSLSVEYNTDIYTEGFIVALLHHFEAFLKTGMQQPDQAIHTIEMVTPTEKNKLLTEFNTPPASCGPSSTVVHLISAIAEKNPDKTALIYQGEETSYAFLEEYSNRLAHHLENRFAIRKGDFIGIALERNSWTIITMLAILKTGAVYVPIDPAYPETRKNYISEDSGCRLIITNAILEECRGRMHGYPPKYASEATPEDLAYVIYTSGSTGNPKGVQITHASLADYATTFQTYFGITAQDSIVQQASISFDTSIEEIFPILISGGTLVSYETKSDFEGLFRLCEQHNITVLSTNPYALQFLNNAYGNYNLAIRTLISGGDVLKPEYIHNIWDKVAVYNTYGPTESTVCATYYPVTSLQTAIPIGKPIANRQVYILEPGTTQLAPIGVAGELCISGEGLSAGYLNQPELTREKFVPHPFHPETLLYRTGDLAYWLADGNIGYVGRIDHQVKIRGFRIELGEIEAALLEYSQEVLQAIADVKEVNGEKVLVGYYVCGTAIDKSSLRAYLQERLPEHMVPAFYIALESLPLTSNGKTDRKALPDVNGDDLIRREYVAPRNPLEEEIATIWKEILSLETIGITDNFFELGGHSLILLQVMNKIQKQLHKSISFKDFFSHPTIEGLSGKLADFDYQSIPKAPQSVSYPISSTQKQLWILSQFEGGTMAYNISIAVKIKGALDTDKLEKSFQMLLNRHEILRTTFQWNEKGTIEQFIAGQGTVHLNIEKVEFLSEENNEHAIKQYINAANEAPFDLQKAPLLKVSLIRTNHNEHLVFFSMHHIIGDGWSLEIIINEVLRSYNDLTSQRETGVQELGIQFKDFVSWRNGQKEDYLQSEAYWLGQFTGELPVLTIPSLKDRPLTKTFNGGKKSHQFSYDFTNELKAFAQNQDITLFMALLSGVNVLLYTYSNQEDIIIGTPLAGRNHPDTESLIGLFLNIIPIRSRIQTEGTFESFLQKQKSNLLHSFRHQDYPLIDLIEKLDLDRDASRSPLFDVMMSLNAENKIIDYSAFRAFEIESFEIEKEAAQFDLNFVFNQSGPLGLTIEYNTDIFEAFEIERIFSDFEKIWNKAFANPAMVLKEFTASKKETKKRNINRMSDFLKI